MEYKNLQNDFILRCLENYKKSYDYVEYEVTQAISTLLVICIIMISDNKHNKSKSNIIREYREIFNDLFVKYSSLKTDDNLYKNINNIRNGLAHMIENDFQAIANDEKSINIIKFKSDAMEEAKKVDTCDIHRFLLDLYEIFKK